MFKQFLIGYVSNGCTTTRGAMKELNQLTDEFLDDIRPDYYFNEITLIDYVETMRDKLSSENEGFFRLRFKRSYYVTVLEKYIKSLTDIIDSDIHIRGVNYFDSDSSDSDTV